MKAMITYLWIQFKIDLRDKGTLLNFYLVPLVFFLVMGAVFSSITPMMRTTLSATMTIFAITMGAVMGSPTSVVKMRETGSLRAFKINGIPGTTVVIVHAISAFFHLFLVSIIIFVLSPILFGAQLPASILLYFVIMAVYLLACVGIGMLIGVTAPNQSFSTMMEMVIFLPSLLLSGIMFPNNLLPAILRWVGRLFPATFSLQSFYGLAYRTGTEIDPLLSLVIVGAFCVIAFLLVFWRLGNLSKTEQQ
jgi:ABC-2 type transport system permease protein